MKNNLLKYAVIFLSIISLTISSCTKKEENSWAEISGGYAEYFAYNYQYNIISSNSTVNTDSLIIGVNINFNIEYPDYSFFDDINPIRTYDPDYSPKLKHSISNIILRSTYDFNNISAGEPLNDIVEVIEQPYFDGYIWVYSNEISLQEYGYKNLVQLTNPFAINNQFFIKFKEKPTQSIQKFELDFIDSQGTHFYIKMEKINWI